MIKENPYKFNYMMLGRLQADVKYFLGYGGGNVKHLYYDTIDEHIGEMKRLWNNFPNELKPEWLSYDEIEEYETQMKNYNQ